MAAALFHLFYSLVMGGVYFFLLMLLPVFFLILPAKGRRLAERLGFFRADEADGPLYWIHAVSAGEVAVGAAVFHALFRDNPRSRAIVTTHTAAGRAIAARDFSRKVAIVAPPIDSGFAVRRFIRRNRPTRLILVELELWPNLIGVAKRAGLQPILCNARMPQRDFRRYSRLRFYFRKVLGNLSLVCAQSDEDARRYAALGVLPERSLVCGNVKYDLLKAEGASMPLMDLAASAVVIGSSHPEEESVFMRLVEAVLDRFSDAVVIWAPRQLSRAARLARLAKECGIGVRLRSEVGVEPDCVSWRLLILDTIGELSGVYRSCAVAVIGGSFSLKVQGHNPLEASAASVPVVFGPCMENFSAIAADLLRAKGARCVADGGELIQAVLCLLEDPQMALRMGRNGCDAVAEAAGAAEATARQLFRPDHAK